MTLIPASLRSSKATLSNLPNMPSCDSLLSKYLCKFGLGPIAWSLRRLFTPVDASALVLEVGSGGNPYPRSNVLLDAYQFTRERHWAPLTTDRPTVLGFVENLPFKDKAFDFVIASHVLEHSKDPEKFLSELQRVAKSGYIEVPDAFMERLNPYRDHRLEITLRNDRLIIYKKISWVVDEYLNELHEDRCKKLITSRLIPNYPHEFHVRYFWEDIIQYQILNPHVDASWDPPASDVRVVTRSVIGKLKQYVYGYLRVMLTQSKRNKLIDIKPLMRCAKCHSEMLSYIGDSMSCDTCGSAYPVRGNLFVMNENPMP